MGSLPFGTSLVDAGIVGVQASRLREGVGCAAAPDGCRIVPLTHKAVSARGSRVGSGGHRRRVRRAHRSKRLCRWVVQDPRSPRGHASGSW